MERKSLVAPREEQQVFLPGVLRQLRWTRLSCRAGTGQEIMDLDYSGKDLGYMAGDLSCSQGGLSMQ